MKNNSEIAIVYPMGKEFVEIIKYRNMLENYEKLIPVSFVGQSLENRDVGELVKGSHIGIEITSDFEKKILDATEIIFTEFSDIVYKKIMYSIEKKKNIVCLCELEHEVEEKIIQKCKENGLTYKNYCNLSETYPELKENRLKQVCAPILLICGLSEYTNKFELQLKIRNEFIRRGYSVSQVGSRKYSSLFGMHNFPQFMFDDIQDSEKIYLFNSYVKQIEDKEKPDIIIIGVPGGVMPYDADHPNGFGIANYLVSNALNVDYALLSLAYNEYDESFWNFVINYMKFRYEYPVQSFHLANIFHDVYGDERNDRERLIYVNQKKVEEKIKTFARKDIFNLNNEEAFANEINEIIDYLSN